MEVIDSLRPGESQFTSQGVPVNPPTPTPDRRLTDRRQKRREGVAQESWFGAVNAGNEAPLPDDVLRDDDASRFDPAPSLNSRRDDLPFKSRQAASVAASNQAAFERIYRAFIAARATLGVALVIALLVAGVFGTPPSYALTLVSIAYAAMALSMWLLPRFRTPVAPKHLQSRLRRSQWLATIGADLVCFMSLHIFAPGSSLNYVALLVLPVLMAGVMTPRVLALATASAVTLALLATAWLSVLAGGDSTAQLTQAGLAGTGFFVITILANQLAGRLAREEIAARDSLESARQQAQLNRLVIEEMQDGVLVVDRHGRVRAVNPAAQRLLAQYGMSRPAPFQLQGVAAWDALVRTVERAFKDGIWPEAGRDVVLTFDAGVLRTLRVRIRFTREREPQASEELCVLFLEDVRNMQARSRQEKLAAMGRVSAGIAHEIRNPLAAIAQANALLSEDAVDPAQRQLTRMVSDNVARLKRIVDDVMEVAPSATQEVSVIDATTQVAAVCSEWAGVQGILPGNNSMLRVDLPDAPLGVLFDGEHLRRVLVNLLDNARRHASQAPGAVHVRLDSRREGQAFLSVVSDGALIPPDVEPYLFEPFFSTRSRGTGLGLYICRELCDRYGATVDFRLRTVGSEQRNEFFVDMRSEALGPVKARAPLTS